QILTTPAATDTPVSVSTDNPAIATATAGVVLAGQTSTSISITTVADGATTLTLRAGNEIRSLTVFVGAPPVGSAPLLFASPIGVSLSALPTLGRVFAPLAASRTLGIRLFESPVASDTIVTVTSSDPNVVTVNGPVIVHAGEQIANLDLTTGAAGTATLTIDAAGVRRELTRVVGSGPTPGTT